jgi:hypothetical protein
MSSQFRNGRRGRPSVGTPRPARSWTSYGATHPGSRGGFSFSDRWPGGDVRYDSDFDVIIDFPESLASYAWDFVEQACHRHGLRPDIHSKATSGSGFLKRISREAVVLDE